MAEKPKAYERVSRSRFFLNGIGSLWLGKDHLLQVTNTFAVEEYRRWYLREIQSFVLRRTSGRMIWNIVLGVIALLFFVIAGAAIFAAIEASAGDDRVMLSIIGGLAAFLGLALCIVALINTAMGPSCTVFIQTPHGLDRLRSPGRLSSFEKLAVRLQPVIESAQAPAGHDQLREIAASLDKPVA